MSNIVEFPPSDLPIAEDEPLTRTERHAEAFCDLEIRISDCMIMAIITLEMVDRVVQGREEKHEKAMFSMCAHQKTGPSNNTVFSA